MSDEVSVSTRILIWAALSLALTACAVAVPVHEAEPPEVLGNWGFRVAHLAGHAPLLATPSNTITSKGDQMLIEGWRVGFGFLDRFQLNADLFTDLESTGTSIALKYQWTGNTYFNAAQGNSVQTSVLRYWSGLATNTELNSDFQYKYGDLGGSGFDLTQLFGYRFVSWFGVYGGPKVMSGRVVARYKNTNDGPVVSSDGRNFWGGGGVAGVFLSPHGEYLGLDLTLEAEMMNLPKTYSDDRVWYSNVMLSLGIPFAL